MKALPVFMAAALLCFGATGVAAETVWKWTGKDGKPAFGKQPPAGVKAEQVDIREANAGHLGANTDAGAPGNPGGKPGSLTFAGKGNPAAQAAMQPIELNGKIIESGSVRLRARAEGVNLNARRTKCPPEVPACRAKGDSPPAGRPSPPPIPAAKGGGTR